MYTRTDTPENARQLLKAATPPKALSDHYRRSQLFVHLETSPSRPTAFYWRRSSRTGSPIRGSSQPLSVSEPLDRHLLVSGWRSIRTRGQTEPRPIALACETRAQRRGWSKNSAWLLPSLRSIIIGLPSPGNWIWTAWPLGIGGTDQDQCTCTIPPVSIVSRGWL